MLRRNWRWSMLVVGFVLFGAQSVAAGVDEGGSVNNCGTFHDWKDGDILWAEKYHGGNGGDDTEGLIHVREVENRPYFHDRLMEQYTEEDDHHDDVCGS